MLECTCGESVEFDSSPAWVTCPQCGKEWWVEPHHGGHIASSCGIMTYC
jgi:hypothetical protein